MGMFENLSITYWAANPLMKSLIIKFSEFAL